jgi:hypothetical protein
VALNRKAEVEKLLQRAIRDYPGTEGAAWARSGLKEQPPVARAAGDQAMPLPILGKELADRVPVSDVTREASLAVAVKVVAPPRVHPVPFVPLNLPDPFERRQTVKLSVTPEEDPVPVARPTKP